MRTGKYRVYHRIVRDCDQSGPGGEALLIELNSVTKSYDGITAVDGISFATEKGKIFGLIGPNGAGKTTIIRMIMNIIAPDTGEISFEGKLLGEEDKDRIGYLPEERGLYKKNTVHEILLYFGRLKNAPDTKLEERIDYWLQYFSLQEWKDRKIEELSKGMAQKIQFISAVAHDPDILFFDEPFSGLDPVSTDQLREAISSLASQGKTILFSTHIMDQAEKICSDILLIDHGQQILYGPVKEIKDRFGKRTVSIEFTGDASFVRGLPQVERLIEYPQFLEISLTADADADSLLCELAGRISIRKFEVSSPSLHNIFVSLITTAQKEAAVS